MDVLFAEVAQRPSPANIGQTGASLIRRSHCDNRSRVRVVADDVRL